MFPCWQQQIDWGRQWVPLFYFHWLNILTLQVCCCLSEHDKTLKFTDQLVRVAHRLLHVLSAFGVPYHPGRRGKASLQSLTRSRVFLVKGLSESMSWEHQSLPQNWTLHRNVCLFKNLGKKPSQQSWLFYIREHPFPRFPFTLPGNNFSRLIAIVFQPRVLKQLSLCLRKQCFEFLPTQGLILTPLQFLLVDEMGNGWDVTPSNSGVSIDSDMDIYGFQVDADKISFAVFLLSPAFYTLCILHTIHNKIKY